MLLSRFATGITLLTFNGQQGDCFIMSLKNWSYVALKKAHIFFFNA